MKSLSKEIIPVLIFLSPKNPLLVEIYRLEGRNKPLTDKAVKDITGKSYQTRKNWRSGTTLRQTTFDEIIKDTRAAISRAELSIVAQKNKLQATLVANKLRERLAVYNQAVIDKLHIYDIANVLGMSITDCQQTLDNVFYEDFPLFPWLHYSPPTPNSNDPAEEADQHLDKYEGIYWVFVKRNEKYLRAVLRVRYLLKSGKGRFIRCKMNFPMEHLPKRKGDDNYWQYDGSVAVREGKVFWIFEKRKKPRHDYFFFITGIAETYASAQLFLSGQYLTTGQDPNQSVVSDQLLMERIVVEPEQAQSDYRALMMQPAVLDGEAEIAEINKKWETHGAELFPNSSVGGSFPFKS